MLVERTDQVITVTDVQRRTKALFQMLRSGKQDRYVVLRDGEPVFVMMRLVEIPGRSLLDRADQAITTTEVQREAKEIFDKLQSGRQDRFVVICEGKPEIEFLPVSAYKSLLDFMQNARKSLL